MRKVLLVVLACSLMLACGNVYANDAATAVIPVSGTDAVVPGEKPAFDPSSLIVDESVFERNSLGYVSAHHAVDPWITVSARILYPKMTLGVNPNINNGNVTFKYQDNNNTQRTAVINVNNVMKDGYIDLVGLSGMEQQFSATPEVDLTIGHGWEFSWARLSGSGSGKKALTVSVDGATPETIMASAQTDMTLDLLSFQKTWSPIESNWIDVNLLLGLQGFWMQDYNYNYSVPIPNMKQTVWSGSGKVNFPVGTPYYGAGVDLQFGNFTISGSYSGTPGLDNLLSRLYNVDLQYYVIQADVNYAFTDNIAMEAGYKVFNLNPKTTSGFTDKNFKNFDPENGFSTYDGMSALIRAEGPYGALVFRF